MSPRVTLATARRVLAQLRGDPRTIALLLLRALPADDPAALGLRRPAGDLRPVGLQLLGIFPFVTMFLVTSVAMLRERTSGTLERLLTTPLGKLDLLLGYALAFGVAALAQATLASALALGVLGLDPAGSIALVLLLAVADAVLGMALGLLVSAFAQTEFQAVQFLPAFVLPQILLCGLIAPRDADGRRAGGDHDGAADDLRRRRHDRAVGRHQTCSSSPAPPPRRSRSAPRRCAAGAPEPLPPTPPITPRPKEGHDVPFPDLLDHRRRTVRRAAHRPHDRRLAGVGDRQGPLRRRGARHRVASLSSATTQAEVDAALVDIRDAAADTRDHAGDAVADHVDDQVDALDRAAEGAYGAATAGDEFSQDIYEWELEDAVNDLTGNAEDFRTTGPEVQQAFWEGYESTTTV